MKEVLEKSIFVSANAGSGKTYALVMRVLGLLLEGAAAGKILCITYTNAGALEMKERLKRQMLEWHNAVEPKYMGEKLVGEKAKIAQGIYMEMLKTGKFPKICTFHSFCMEVVGAFNVEAEAPYTFNLLSDIAGRKIKRGLAEHIMENPIIKQKTAELSGIFTVNRLAEDVVSKITSSRDVLADILAFEGLEYTVPYKVLGIPYKTQKLAEILLELKEDLLKKLDVQPAIGVLSSMELGASDGKFLRKICGEFEDIRDAFLTQKNEIRKNAITKKLKEQHPYLEDFEAESSGLFEEYISLKSRYISAKVSQIIAEIGQVILKGYEAKKRELISLDFDDLINLTEKALKGDSRDFILFKLDGGISHILVDEAQDTNAKQWSILESILEEFFSGGAVEPKTLFVVGDYKQSIYSFQGAQVEVFNDVYRKYKANFERVEMQKSYRSSGSVLRFVDEVFSCVEGFDSRHASALNSDYCYVEAVEMPVFERQAKNTSEVWQMPWEDAEEGTLQDEMAAQICLKVREVLGKGYEPKDVMMLMKARDLSLISKIKKRLSDAGISFVFNDEIAYSESLPLNDIISYLKFLALPLDDYAKMCVLRSPFYGISEREVGEICKGASAPPEILKFEETDLEALFFRIFHHFLPRYGEFERREAAVIFDLLREYEAFSDVQSLSGFLKFFESVGGERFKISLESTGENSVKLSTVHAAKGLESPVVFVLNATEGVNKAEKQEDLIIGRYGAGAIALFGGGEGQNSLFLALKEARLDAAYQEYLRLLYVALTRAKSEIYVFGKKASVKPDSWYDLVKEAIFRLCGGSVYKNGVLPHKDKLFEAPRASKIVVKDVDIQALRALDAAEVRDFEARQPSRGAKYGEAVHILLQTRDFSKESAMRFFSLRFAEFSPAECESLIDVAMRNLRAHPELFSRGLTEVAIGNFRLDRLIIDGARAVIIDYKFYREEVLDDGILQQLANYKAAVQKAYGFGENDVVTKILWLNSAVLEEVALYLSP